MQTKKSDSHLQQSSNVNNLFIDQQHPISEQFGFEMAEKGLNVLDISDDSDSLWYENLINLSPNEPTIIAGLTNHRTLICLENFARSFNLITVYKGEHTDSGTEVLHRVQGAKNIINQITADKDSNASWTTQLADLVAGCTNQNNIEQSTSMFSTPPSNNTANHSGTLFSWVMVSRNISAG